MNYLAISFVLAVAAYASAAPNLSRSQSLPVNRSRPAFPYRLASQHPFPLESLQEFPLGCLYPFSIESQHPTSPDVPLSYDDIMNAQFTDVEYFDEFHSKLTDFAKDKKTKDIFAKSKFNRPSFKYLDSASKEFKSLCGAIYKEKKEQQPQKKTDAELAYDTIILASRRMYCTYKGRLIGEDSAQPKMMLKRLINTDPIKCFVLLATKRSDMKVAIEQIMGPFEVSREEAALRHFIVEQEDGQLTNGCSQFMRALIKL